MAELYKYGYRANVPVEVFQEQKYSRFSRRVKSEREVPVPADEMAAFLAWRAAFAPLEEEGRGRGWYWVEDSDIQEPQPDVEYEYAETVEEFHARVDAAIAVHDATGEWPKGTEPLLSFIPNIWRDAVIAEFINQAPRLVDGPTETGESE